VDRQLSMDFPVLHEAAVLPEWIDYNGHMNLAYYVVVFDQATDVLYDRLGIWLPYREATGNSCFTVETHTIYEQEVKLGDRLRVQTRLLGADAKRLHYFHEMFHAELGYRAAVQELMALHVDLGARRTTAFPPDRDAAIQAALAGCATLPPPKEAGRRIAMPVR
jgi:acyl-CoA thioester hydrolase